MNIAIVIEQLYDPFSGGVQKTTSKLFEIFKKHHHHVVIISLSQDIKFDDYDGVVHNLDLNNRESKLRKIFIENSIDICINQAGYSLSITKLLLKSKASSTKIINTLRINPLNFYTNYNFLISTYLKSRNIEYLQCSLVNKLILLHHILKQRKELKFIIKNVDAFVLLSNRFRNELYQLAPGIRKYEDKILGISNPFKMPTKNYVKYDKSNVIIYVGRLELGQKRVDILIAIWQKLHEQLKEWEFWIVGQGEQENYLKKFCQENNLHRIKFFGKRKPDEFYQKAKIFNMTSAFEGFGNVLVESQSYGCVPILFNSYSAASEIINHDIDGILVKPFNIEEYVSSTLDLIKDKSKFEMMSRNAFINAQRFSYEVAYEKWDSLFQSLDTDKCIGASKSN